MNILCDNIEIISKNKEKLEKNLDVKITVKKSEIIIEGSPENEYIAEKIIEAIDFGFPLSVALLIKKEDFLFEILEIKNYTKRKDLETIRARIIGKDGKTLKTLSSLTECNFELKGNCVGIIGSPESIKNSQTAIISIIQGSKQANVYSFLEKHHAEPVLDWGLKERKKTRKRVKE